MSAVTRVISFTYGTFTSGTSGDGIIGNPVLERSGTTFTFSCRFVVRGTTVATANTAFDTAVAACQTWNQRLRLTYESTTVEDFNPASGTRTGFLMRPVIRKTGSPNDTPISREYEFTVTGIEPGTVTGNAGGFREWSANVGYDSARRQTVTFTLHYTASGANTALTNWQDGTNGAKAQANNLLTTLGGNYQLVSEFVPQEDQSQTALAGTLTYQQRLIPETSGGGTDNDYIIESLSVAQAYDEESFFPDEIAVVLQVSFALACDHEQTANNYDDLRGVYEAQFKPFVLQHLADVYSGVNQATGPQADGTFIILGDSVAIHTASNRISGSMRVLASAGFDLQRLRWSVRFFLDDRELDRARLDGKDFTFSTWTLGKELRAVETITALSINSPYEIGLPREPRAVQGGAGLLIEEAKGAGGDGEWRRSTIDLAADATWIGHFNGTQIQRYARSWNIAWRWHAETAIVPPAPVITS